MSTHVWRQTETQTVIENFYEEDFNVLNPRKNSRGSGPGFHRKEFPIMQWSFAWVHYYWGTGISITRVLSFLISILSVLGIYGLVQFIFKNKLLAAATAWAFNFSPLFYYYAVSPMPDNFALMTAIWAWLFFLKGLQKRAFIWFGLMSLLLALSFAAKLPFVVFYGLPGYILMFYSQTYQISNRLKKYALIAMILCFMAPLAWYAWVIPTWKGNPIVKGIFNGDNLQQAGAYFWHYLISTLPELLLNYGSLLFFLMGLYKVFQLKLLKNPLVQGIGLTLLGTLFYVGFEINAITNVHAYYLMPFLPMLFLVVALGLAQWAKHRYGLIGIMLILCLLPLTAALRINHRWNATSPGFNADLLTHRTALRAAVPDSALVVAGNDVSTHIVLYHLHKKGWTFNGSQLNAHLLKRYINEGAEYLYSDDPLLLKNAKIEAQINDTVLTAGSFRVYRLKPK